MFRKALIPIDGSELASAALTQAANVLGTDGEALVVEVVDSVAQILTRTTGAGYALLLADNVLQEVVEAQRVAAREHLAAAHRRLAQVGVTRIETQIVEGEPGPILVELARTARCDIVVMATHGRSGLKRAVLGSVADHVVRHLTGVPVLLVHPEEVAAEPPAPAVTAGR